MTTDNRTPGETRRVHVREVGPRDGFQNEPETIATADKVALINALGEAGFTRIEVASFVRPDVIPQLSDGVEVLRAIGANRIEVYGAPSIGLGLGAAIVDSTARFPLLTKAGGFGPPDLLISLLGSKT